MRASPLLYVLFASAVQGCASHSSHGGSAKPSDAGTHTDADATSGTTPRDGSSGDTEAAPTSEGGTDSAVTNPQGDSSVASVESGAPDALAPPDAPAPSLDAGDATGTLAVAMNTFLSSIGVCAHVTQGVDDPTQSATAMSFIGARNMRDDGNPATVPSWLTIHQNSGVLMDVLTDQDVTSTLGYAEQLAAAGALLAVEGPNEPNNFPVTYNGATSGYTTTFMPVAQLQRDLYSAVKADPKLAGIPVFHASEAGGSEPDNVGLQFLTIPTGAGIAMPDGTQYADYGNTHNYITGHSNALSDNLCWNASSPTLNGDWDGMYVEYGITWHEQFMGYSNAQLPTTPRVTTETGWTTMGQGSITEEQQARLFLNLYLAAFKQGISYTFIYMLRDDPVQGYWGFVDTSYNPKTSGTYLHNMTTILADTATFTPGHLDYSIANEPMTVHDLLLEKGNGTFELAVWNEQPMGGTQSVAVDLGHTRATVNVYDPTTGTAPVQVLTSVSTVTLMLTDHPMIVEL